MITYKRYRRAQGNMERILEVGCSQMKFLSLPISWDGQVNSKMRDMISGGKEATKNAFEMTRSYRGECVELRHVNSETEMSKIKSVRGRGRRII